VSADPRLEELLGRLERERVRLEATDDADEVVGILTALAELAREVQAEIDRLRREGADALS
jgi:hypothetical protein